MSTDYHIACTRCKKAVWCAQIGMSGFTFYSGERGCMDALETFLDPVSGHGSHEIAFISEHVVDSDDGYEVVEWRPKHSSTESERKP